MGIIVQLFSIIWKDVYVQLLKRHYFIAMAEILLVLFSFLGIENDRPVLQAASCDREPCLRLSQPRSYEERNLSAFRAPQLILYTPNTTHAQELMNAAFPPQRPKTVGYADLDTMARVFYQIAPQPKLGPEQRIVALELMSHRHHNQKYPRKLEFSVSLYDNFYYLSQRHKSARSFEPLPTPFAQRESVAYCQMALAHAHLSKMRAEYGYQGRPYSLSTHRVPDGPFPNDVQSGYGLTAIRVGLGYMMPFCLLVARLVEENQSGMREKLRLVGLNNSVYWLGHFLASLAVGLVAIVCNIVHMLFVPNWYSGEHPQTYLTGIDVTVVFVSLLLFINLYIAKAMLVSLFFRNSSAAVVFAMVMWITGYLVPWYALDSLDGYAAEYIVIGRITKLASAVLPCMGLHWCFRILGCAAIAGEPYSLKNTNEEVLGLDNVLMFEIWVVMLSYTIVFWILIWYFQNVLTWAVGVPLDPWYPFTIKYWMPGAQGSVQVIEPRVPDGYHFQPYPPGEAAVTVSQLEYERKEKHILRDTNFKAYHGEILGIVAPNGSGKTSLCNILTGHAIPSAGQVTVLGYDMMLQTAWARQHVAYVEQSDVLFSELTVHEHLLFFGSVKDDARAILDQQIVRLRNMLKLDGVMNTLCADLNKSQRKLLSLATALVTCPKVLVMDEAMIKMDPASRDVAWEALTSLKSSMCIIAATANMYEVDTRADRLLVLGYAAHKCYGTTAFIQRRYGWGYSVKIIKGPQFRGRDVVASVRQTIPEAHVLQDHRNFATIGLGAHPDYAAVAVVLNRLESEQRNLGIESFTISFVTMEDIFFRIILEMDAGDTEFKKRMALGSRTSVGEEPIDYSMANLTVATEKHGGIMRPVEKYESSLEIQEHVRALYDLKPQKPGWGTLFLAMIFKRRYYTWQTVAMPLLCWIVPTAILAVRGHIESTDRVAVRFSADHLVYDLGMFDKSESVFVNFNEASEAIAELGYEEYVRSREFDVRKVEMAVFLDEKRRNRGGGDRFLFGAQFTAQANDTSAAGKAVAWYEGGAFHSQSLSLGVLSTVLLRRVTNDSTARVLTVLRPVPRGKTFISSRHLENAKYAEELRSLISSRLMHLILLPAAISVVTASFVLFPIDDRVSRSKRMQFVSGTPTFIYWLSNYAWDLFMSLIGLLCLLFPAFYFFQNFRSAVGMGILIYVAYIHSMLPFVYFYSFVTDSMIAGFLVVCTLTCFLGMVTTMGYQQYVIALDRGRQLISEVQSRDALLYLLYLCPPFSASWALIKTIQLGVENAYCTHAVNPAVIFDVCAFVRNSVDDAAYMLTGLRYCCATYYSSNYTAVNTLSPSSFHRDGAMTEIVVMLMEGMVCFVLLVVCEQASMRHWYSRPQAAGDLTLEMGDHADINAEQQYVHKVLRSQDLTKPSLLVVGLKKVYDGYAALRGVTFHVEPGETFAVMGMLGCGKSTLLSVLSGITPASGGEAYIGDTPLRNVARWEKCIGLCPDYDSFLGRLTVRQTLMMYAHVRGVLHPDGVTLVDHIFSLLQLTSVADDTVDSCSASDRRKLAVGVAIVGLPPVLLMDDPATGLDMFAKRTIYKTVHMLRRLSKSAVLLVTTSLCDAVVMSDRMSIMVDGRLRCIGTLDEIRAGFCRGFVIRIKLKPDAYGNPAAWTAVDGSVKAAFPTAAFAGQLARFVEYGVDRVPPWRQVANILADLKLRLQEFTDAVLLSEMTLEHVLLKIAKYQDAPIRAPGVAS